LALVLASSFAAIAAPPPIVDGLVGHYDASALEGLDDGDFVDLWDDVSGNGNDATNEFTPELSPLYSSDAAAGLPALEFLSDEPSAPRVGSELETFLDLPDMVEYGFYEFVLVVKFNRTSIDPDDQYFIRSNSPVRFRAGVSGTEDQYYYRINEPTSRIPDADTEWHIHFISNNDDEQGNLRIFIDETLAVTQTITIPEDPLLRDVDLGHNPNDGSTTSKDPFDGFIAEVLVYNRALDDDERNAVGLCLADKYNLDADFPGDVACPTEEPTCPEPDVGDTHCRQLEIAGPSDSSPGVYTVSATGEDDSGDDIFYVFRADNGVDEPLESRRPSSQIDLDLGEGTWTIQVTTDDSCPALAGDSTCSQEVVVACPSQGDTHCQGITVDGPEGNIRGDYVVTAQALDDGGDAPETLLYTFSASNGADEPQVVVSNENSATFTFLSGTWTVTVTVDDSELCADVADDNTCTSEPIVIAAECPKVSPSVAITNDTLFFWQFEGPIGDDVVDDPDLANGDVDLLPFRAPDADEEDTLTHGPGNPFFNPCGTSVEFRNPTTGNRNGTALFAADTGIDTDLDMSTVVQFTLEAFIYAFDIRQAVVMRKYTPGSHYIDLRGNGSLNFVINDDSNVVSTPDGSVEPNTWYHVAATFDAEDIDAPMKIYLNGELAGQGGLPNVVLDSERAFGVGAILRDNDMPPSDTGQFFNGRIDEVRLSAAALSPDEFLLNLVSGGKFQRGNANGDPNFDLSDGVFVLNFLFLGGATPSCMKSLDANDSGELDLTDGVYVLNHLFLGGPAPAPPGTVCGTDPTPDDLSCDSFAACP